MPVYLLFLSLFFGIPLVILGATHRGLLWRYRKTIALLWWRQGARLWKERQLIVAATAIVTVFGFLVWPYGLAWKCWGYSPSKILGTTVLGTVFEDIVWWLCISLLFSCTVTLLARFEDEGKPLIAALLTGK